MRRWLIAVPILLLLCGSCTTPLTTKTITLNPTMVNYSDEYWDSSSTWCSVPLPGQGVPLYGTGPPPVGPWQAFAGYQDIYEPGAQPFPCNYNQQNLYRGQVAFDLSQFKEILGAQLVFNVAQSMHSNGGVNQDNPPVNYANTLGMSTGTSNGDNGPYYWNYDNPAGFSCQGTKCTIPVRTQVTQWLTGAHANNGFIIAGPVLNFPSSLPNDNNGQVSWYSGFQLQVTYNPLQNPNAPK
jgi:hypothetical protein